MGFLDDADIPTPGDPGPDWATDIATYLELNKVAAHDWVIPAGLTIAEAQDIVDAAEATYLGVAGGGGVVRLAPGVHDWATGTLRFKKTGMSLIGAGAAATIIDYGGTGACIKWENDPTTIQQQGVIGGFTILGNANANALGIWFFDTGVVPTLEDLVIDGFTGASGRGILLENLAVWNERFSANRVRLDNNKVGLRMYSPPASPFISFGYARVTDLRVGVNNGQIGIQAAGSALVYNGFWNIQSNGGGGTSTIISVEDTAIWNASIVNVTGEALGVGANVEATATFNVNSTCWGPAVADVGDMEFGVMMNSVGQLACGVNLPAAIAMGANAGAGAPAAIVKGSTLDGDVTFGTGTSPVAGAMMVMTYGWPFQVLRADKRPSIVICPLNRASAALRLYVESLTQAGCVIGCDVAPTASQANTVYGFTYHVMG